MGLEMDRALAQAVDGTPFNSADEAWIWAVQGMRSRMDGANMKGGMAKITRTCEATDILLSAYALRRAGKITDGELGVMLLYGTYSVAPKMLGKVHAVAVPVWRRGIDALIPILEQKGIILSQRGGGANG